MIKLSLKVQLVYKSKTRIEFIDLENRGVAIKFSKIIDGTFKNVNTL